MKKNIFLVTTEHATEGIFENEELANEFAKFFSNSRVEKEILYTELPTLYNWECRINIQSGEVVSLNRCNPSLDPVLMTLDKETLLAVGESEERAKEAAMQYRKILTNS
jgi:hypothetical protein